MLETSGSDGVAITEQAEPWSGCTCQFHRQLIAVMAVPDNGGHGARKDEGKKERIHFLGQSGNKQQFLYATVTISRSLSRSLSIFLWLRSEH